MENNQPTTTIDNLNLCSGGLQDKDNNCSTLATKSSCGDMDCCVWARNKTTDDFSCVGGDAGGATYNGSDYDAFFYKNKRFPNSDTK